MEMAAPGMILTVSIERLSLGGEGVARSDGRVVFVPHSVPGDMLEVQITESQSRFLRARIRRVLTAGENRQLAPCPYHFQPSKTVHPQQDAQQIAGVDETFYCGGCNWQQLKYTAQLENKRALVQETLERIGGVRGVAVKPVIGMSEPWRYRNKVQQPVGWNAQSKEVISGFFAPQSHAIVPIEDCLVQPEISVAIIQQTRRLMSELGIRIYDEDKLTGTVRHLLVRTTLDGNAMLTIVTRTEELPKSTALVEGLAKLFPTLVGVHQNINPSKTNVILGRHWHALAGDSFVEERMGPLRFRLSPAAFFQVNTLQASALYNVTKRLAGTGRRLLDLFCGVGGIALWLADQFSEVGGVEEVRPAIQDAQSNAQLNGIHNARFVAKPVEEFLSDAGAQAGRGLTVTLDPPRSGLTPTALRRLIALCPERIVYVSCDPGTLARDLSGLIRAGYAVQEVQPVDLFPQTSHIETAVKLTR